MQPLSSWRRAHFLPLFPRRRDRAPFVFTSDMAYVINGGDKPSSRFHDFVDLCCQAYNLIRKHTHLFLNLLGLVRAWGLSLPLKAGTGWLGGPRPRPTARPHPCLAAQMLSCGIPELSDLEDLKYVYDALRPQDTDADATTYFTRYGTRVGDGVGGDGGTPRKEARPLAASRLARGLHGPASPSQQAASLQVDRVQPGQRGHQAQLLHPQPGADEVHRLRRPPHALLCPPHAHHQDVRPDPRRLPLPPREGVQPQQGLREWGQPEGTGRGTFPIPEPLTLVGTGCPGVSIPPRSPFSPQTYVVKVQRESPSEVVFVQRTFEEFQELHNKLRLLFPSSLLPRYPRRPYTGGSPDVPQGL